MQKNCRKNFEKIFGQKWGIVINKSPLGKISRLLVQFDIILHYIVRSDSQMLMYDRIGNECAIYALTLTISTKMIKISFEEK